MKTTANGSRTSADHRRADLHARLLARREEIEQAALTRVYAISDPTEIADPEYRDGLRTAVSAALDYAFASIEHGVESAPPLPAPLLVQARLAARNGVGLDTVLRRYAAGHALFSDFLIEEAENAGLGVELKWLLGAQAANFDHLLAAVSEEHQLKDEARRPSLPRRQARTVERLLAGEPADMVELSYGFDAWHIGVMAVGPKVVNTIRSTAEALDRRLLAVHPEDGLVWAWLGGSARISTDAIVEHLPPQSPASGTVAIGEPSRGLPGWQLTHRQAERAFRFGLRNGEPVVRYGDVGLVAAVLRDDVLASSLHQLFLAPLAEERDEGAEARRTLRAYFTARGNISSAAAALGVSRQTVASRLHAIEDRLGLSLDSRAVEMEIALRLER